MKNTWSFFFNVSTYKIISLCIVERTKTEGSCFMVFLLGDLRRYSWEIIVFLKGNCRWF